VRDSVRPSARQTPRTSQGQPAPSPPVSRSGKGRVEGLCVWVNGTGLSLPSSPRSARRWRAIPLSRPSRAESSSSSTVLTSGAGGPFIGHPGRRWSPASLSRSGSSRRWGSTGAGLIPAVRVREGLDAVEVCSWTAWGAASLRKRATRPNHHDRVSLLIFLCDLGPKAFQR